MAATIMKMPELSKEQLEEIDRDILSNKVQLENGSVRAGEIAERHGVSGQGIGKRCKYLKVHTKSAQANSDRDSAAARKRAARGRAKPGPKKGSQRKVKTEASAALPVTPVKTVTPAEAEMPSTAQWIAALEGDELRLELSNSIYDRDNLRDQLQQSQKESKAKSVAISALS
jgi:hypothetical protein